MKHSIKAFAKRHITIVGAVCMAGALLLPINNASAGLLFGNNPGLFRFGENDIFSTQWNVAQFTLGGDSYVLDDVVVSASNGGDGTGGLVVEIYDDSGSGGLAGSSIAVLSTTDTLGGSFSNLTYTSAFNLILLANTKYWVVAKGTLGANSSTNNTQLATNANPYSGDPGFHTAVGADVTQYFCADASGACFDSPITWTAQPRSPGGFNESAFAVNASIAPLPAPAGIALFGLGLLAVGRLLRRS
ncbi:MAG: hypothetical protein HOI95_12940 [Chromatiales bacterium]|nr:hypothetical protein [Chromatiales bacterium]